MSVDGTPEQAWERYAAFYAKAADWVRGRDVNLDGDGLLEANPSNLSFPRSVTFSSTWMTCSPGWRVAHLGSPCSPARPPIGSYLAMASSSDFWSFTRYVPFAGYDPEPEDVYATARAEVSEDLVGMGTVSVLGAWGGVTPVQRPLLIQEMGFPSSRVYPWDNALAEQQADYVAGAFDAWTEYNQRWTPLPECTRSRHRQARRESCLEEARGASGPAKVFRGPDRSVHGYSRTGPQEDRSRRGRSRGVLTSGVNAYAGVVGERALPAEHLLAGVPADGAASAGVQPGFRAS